MRSDEIHFVITPFLPSHQPALGISNLISLVRSEGHSTTAHYLNVGFGKQIGLKLSRFIENFFSKDLLLGEMIFTPALWGSSATQWSEYENTLKQMMSFVPNLNQFYADIDIIQNIKTIRDSSPDIIDGWANLLIKTNADILAFTTTFQQNVASLALAKRIKEKAGSSSPLIVFGGANCEADMGKAIADNFHFVDCVVSGEGEGAILEIIKARQERKEIERYICGPKINNMNDLPIPDFDDYFKTIKGEAWEKKQTSSPSPHEDAGGAQSLTASFAV